MLRNEPNCNAAFSTDLLEISPAGTVDVLVKAGGRVDQAALQFTVLNASVAPQQNPKIRLAVSALSGSG